MSTYRVLVTDINGSAKAELDNANVESVVEELNEPGSATISMHTLDPDCNEVNPVSYQWQRYLQIWRGGQLRFWGPIVTGNANGDKTTIRALGPLAHLRRRYFGPTPALAEWGYSYSGTTTRSYNEFPSGLGAWTSSGPSQSVSSSTRAEGLNSIRLIGGAFGDLYTEASFDYTTIGGPTGGEFVIFFVVGWFYLASMGAPPYEERGLYVQSQYPIGTLYDEQWASITAATPMGGWYRLETAIKVSRGTSDRTNRIKIRLYSPLNGTIYWDAVNVYMQRSLGANGGEFVDYGTILDRVITYASGADADSQALGKSNLNWGRNIPACGQTDNRFYDLANNQNIWEAVSEYVTRDLYDFAVVPTGSPPTSWTFTGYTPRKGTNRPTLALELGRNVTDFAYDVDGNQTTTKPRVLGRGSGPSKDLFEAMDTTELGGITMESVETVPADAPLSALYPRATELLRMGQSPVKVPTLRTKEGVADNLLAAGLTVGDTVPVRIKRGWINEDATRRIVRIEELPGEILDIGFNDE